MFLKTNDRTVNLRNVSNINYIHDRNRIVFNMNYSITIEYNGTTKTISDYVYWDGINSEDLNTNIEYLENTDYFQDNFIDKLNNAGSININEISSIKFSEKKNRVIFNLSHPVSYHTGNGIMRVTSEFVYVNCKDLNEFMEYSTYVQETMDAVQTEYEGDYYGNSID